MEGYAPWTVDRDRVTVCTSEPMAAEAGPIENAQHLRHMQGIKPPHLTHSKFRKAG
jgi:hypothetical protein